MKAFEILSERFRFPKISNRSVPKKTKSNSQKSSTTNTNTNQIKKDLDDLKAKTSELEKSNAKYKQDADALRKQNDKLTLSNNRYKELLNRPISPRQSDSIDNHFFTKGLTWLGGKSFSLVVTGLGLGLPVLQYIEDTKGLSPDDPKRKEALGALVATLGSQLVLGVAASWVFKSFLPFAVAASRYPRANYALSQLGVPAVKAAVFSYINSPQGRELVKDFIENTIGLKYDRLGSIFAPIASIIEDTAEYGKNVVQHGTPIKPYQADEKPAQGDQSASSPAKTSKDDWYIDTTTGKVSNISGPNSILVAHGPEKTLISSASLASNPELILYRQQELKKGNPDPLLQFVSNEKDLPYLKDKHYYSR